MEPDIIRFYRGEIRSKSGYYIDEVLNFSDFVLETRHDFIQSLFPSFERGMADAYLLNKKAVAIFKRDKELQTKVLESLKRLAEFYGYNINYEKYKIKRVLPIKRDEKGTVLGLYSSHNYLRITRMLKFLVLIGLEDYALLFFLGICGDLSDKEFRERAKGSIQFWKEAINL